MAEKSELVPFADDGPVGQEVLAQIKALMHTRGNRPLGAKLAGDFAEKLRHARYLDQKQRRTA